MMERLIVLVLIILLSPMLMILSLTIVIIDGWPFWYQQERVGYKRKVFKMWKYRTMVVNADKQKRIYQNLNEADGPVFKIKNDPRFTRLGKILSHSGLDELPQLFNVLLGEMSIVGPRPLPVDEAAKIPTKYKKRFEVKSGIISPWIFNGYHKLGFEKWMESDIEYVMSKNRMYDLRLAFNGAMALMKMIVREVIDILTEAVKSG